MSNSLIYEEFQKQVGNVLNRTYTYVRVKCKKCNLILEYSKSLIKKHKGHCRKCAASLLELDLMGKKFGHLTVVKKLPNKNTYKKSKTTMTMWECQCSCGNTISAPGSRLKYGSYISCGCRHGMTLKGYIKANSKIDDKGRWIWTGCVDRHGYGLARYKGKTWIASRLSYTAFISPIPNGMCVCHKNDCRKDVNPDNLFLAKPKYNSADMVIKGRQANGEKNGSSKLTESQVKEIKKLLSEGAVCNHIAKSYNVNFSTIARIRDGKGWSHVPDPD